MAELSVLDAPDTCTTRCAGGLEPLRGPIYKRGSVLLDPTLTASAGSQRPFLPFIGGCMVCVGCLSLFLSPSFSLYHPCGVIMT